MGVVESVNRPAPAAPPVRPERAACPRCGEPAPPAPGVASATLDGAAVSRCMRCGTRCAARGGRVRLVFTCETCGVPFLHDAILPHGEQRCATCAGGRVPPELPDEEIAAATENEIRASLVGRWHFVTSVTAQPYLDRVARALAERIEGSPRRVHVVLMDEAAHRTLALPSGALLVSTGLLSFLEDEAELAFVLGHEIAHAASGEAATRLSRLGFLASASGQGADDATAWADAARDLCALGYGRRRERDADARALEAMLALGYDPESALKYLRRLDAATLRGDTVVSETNTSHPLPGDRARRLEKSLYGRVGEDATPKVNREPFRRVVTGGQFAASLRPARLDPGRDASPAFTGVMDDAPAGRVRLVVAAIAVIAVAAALVGLVLLMR